jgi:hypothetical protein
MMECRRRSMIELLPLLERQRLAKSAGIDGWLEIVS